MKPINLFLYLWFIFYCPLTLSQEYQVPMQPLTKPLPAHSGTQKITADFLLKLPSHEDNYTIQWLDNTHVLYAKPQDNSALFEIGVIDIKTKTKKIYCSGLIPKASPDGKNIAYITEEKGKKQLWLMQNDGAEKKQLTYLKEGFSGGAGYHYDFSWSPDSQFIAIYHQPYIPFWELNAKPSLDKNKSSAIDADHLVMKPPQTEVSIINIKDNSLKKLVSVDGLLRYLSWFPNGKELLVNIERIGFYYNKPDDHDWIKSISIKDGTMRTLASPKGLQQFLRPTASPDGKKVAFVYDADNPLFACTLNLGIVTSDETKNNGNIIYQITHEFKLASPKWAPDGQWIYAKRIMGAYPQIYAFNVISGEAKQITNAPLNIKDFSISSDGNRLAWIGIDAHANLIMRVAKHDGSHVENLANISQTPREMALSEVQEIEWKIKDYPTQMRGLLILPLNYEKGMRYPLVVDIHGGDIGADIDLAGGILVNTPLEWQLWAAKGYVVFVPEMRSSAAFGSIAITRDEAKNHDLLDHDIKDIISGVDTLINRGIADENRMAVIGHSAGGKRANWLTVTTHRFKAVVSKEGWADEWLISGIRPAKRVIDSYGGPPVLVPENYQKNSALFHARGATTPTLFLAGNPKLGAADEYGSVLWLYNALKVQGVDTQYIQYPDESHVFQRFANRKDALERIIRWLDSHQKIR